jgi:signal transduction histidine kinase
VALTLYEKVSLNFGSGVVAVALIGTLSYVSLGKLAGATRDAGDAEAVMEQVDMLRAGLDDAGIAERDYLLGGEADDRERFERARTGARRDLERLQASVRANPESKERVDSLAPAVLAHLDDLERIALTRQQRGLEAAASSMRDEDVSGTHDRVNAMLGEFRDDQRAVYGAHSREQAVRASGAGILLAVGLLISFIAATLALANIRRYLSDRRKLELQRTAVLEQEQAARTAAEEANRAKTDFLRMMSHELRTPLTAIQGYLELLEMGIYGGMTQEQVTILNRIESNERHLLAIINDLLDFARVDARRVELRITALPVRDIRLAVDPVCRPQIDSKQLSYEWRSVGDQMIVRADREKVRQIVVNLVSNACKFTPRGGSIDVECVRLDRSVELRVHDTGPGIPTQKLDAIFEPFVQLDNGLTRSTAGTGLGLAISRELARAMGGDLSVGSSLGQGSTFTLTLPRGDVESDVLPEPTSTSTSASLWGAG